MWKKLDRGSSWQNNFTNFVMLISVCVCVMIKTVHFPLNFIVWWTLNHLHLFCFSAFFLYCACFFQWETENNNNVMTNFFTWINSCIRQFYYASIYDDYCNWHTLWEELKPTLRNNKTRLWSTFNKKLRYKLH